MVFVRGNLLSLVARPYILESFESGCQVDAVLFDYNKSFDMVICGYLIPKLETLGISNLLLS